VTWDINVKIVRQILFNVSSAKEKEITTELNIRKTRKAKEKLDKKLYKSKPYPRTKGKINSQSVQLQTVLSFFTPNAFSSTTLRSILNTLTPIPCISDAPCITVMPVE
jgi:hypothetical protein